VKEGTARTLVAIDELADEELISRHRDGDERAMDALLTRYRNFARSKARSYFLVGADKEDIVQEAMIGLYKAVRDFSHEKETSFRAFAEVCVTRQIITAIKMATRQKHIPLNTYVSLSKPLVTEEEPDRALMDVLQTSQVTDPAELVISSEELRSMKMAFAEILSDFEIDVLHLYVEGKSYQEVAELLDRQVKAVDNALQRIKRKVELHLRSREEGAGGESLEEVAPPAQPGN
jgi:RNA polymerase sporulation-specific sigma factor